MTRRTIVYSISILALCLTLGAAWLTLRGGGDSLASFVPAKAGPKAVQKPDKPLRRRKPKAFSSRPPKCSAIGSPNTTSTLR
ncbi:hypothetical protein HMSSN139_62040 [Paenibacillus sp. HMSSN-139]|nr:hypothetical protein HMSSN139_62040 [Paenibacillus sp. HMSSN-139]